MLQLRRYAVAAGTFSVALGVGYVMQNNATVPGQAQAVTGTMTQETTPLELDKITLTSALPVPTVVASKVVVIPAMLTEETAETTGQSDLTQPVEAACDIDMTATPTPGAMVEVTITAPCLPHQRVTLHHNGMMVTEITGAKGALRVLMPALAEQSVFIAEFASGDGAVANAAVPELRTVDRAVVQWTGNSGLQLHALEYGAKHGGPGHVWANAARDPAAAAGGQGGFLTRHGATEMPNSQMAQVYTFPSGTALRDGPIDLSVEIEVTKANCGKEIDAQSLQVAGGKQPRVQSVTLYMPGCDAIGDFLVLKNLLNDLKVAIN